ncbi:MAG: translation elongation factor Ts [Clostridiales bacterium]|jgi:elongation factor Ts|nr:translation elongation factor Ts [Clostridiales bacterium]
MKITAALVKELRDKTGAGMMDCKKALTETDGDIDKAMDVLREKGLSKATKKADRIAAEGLVTVAFSEDHTKAAVVEINSETDFVAKNPEFVEFVDKIADIVLNNDVADVEALKALPYGEEGTVDEALIQKISKIGEKLSIRRFVKLQTAGNVYVGYIHGGGKIAAVAGIKTDAFNETVEKVGKDVAMQIASMAPRFVMDSEADQEYLEHEKEIARKQLEEEGKPAQMIEKIIPGKIKKVLKEVCLLDQKFVKNGDLTVEQYVADEAKKAGQDMAVTEMVRYEVGEGIEKRNEDFAEEVAKQQAEAAK